MADRNLALNLLIKAKDGASAVVKRFRGEVQDSAQAAEDLDRTLDRTAAGVDQLNESAESAGKSAGYFADQLSDADKAAGRYYDSAGRMHDANGKFVKGAKRARTEADRLGDELATTSRQADGLSGKVTALIGRLKGLVAATAVGAGLKWFFTQSIGSAARFERQMNRVEAVTGATAEEMAKLEQAAEEAGSTTEYSAVEAAEGLEILARAGFNASQSVELLPSVLAVAAAEAVDLATAAGLVSDTLAVMQMEVDKGAQVTDILAKGSSLANTRMTDLGLAISYAGQYAKPAKLDLEKLVAVLDVLANNSLRGERGGTGLRAILAQLSDPASKASQAIKRLNLPTDDFIGLIEGLKQKGPEATEAINAFGIEAGPALRALIAAGAEGITEFEQKLRDVEGAAKEMAKTATDDLPGGIKEAESAWDGLIKTFGKPLLKPLTELARDLAAKFREMKEDGNLKAWGEITAAAVNRVAGGLKILYNTATFATKAIGTFVAQITVWVTEAEYRIARLMSRVGLVSQETVRGLEIQAGGVRAVLNALVKEAEQDLRDMGDGWDLLSGKITLGQQKISTATAVASDSAKTAANDASAAVDAVGVAGDQAASAIETSTRQIIDSFNTARDEGKSTADALSQAFKEVDLTTTDGIAALGNALTEISEQAEGLGTQLQAGLADRLARMTADELEAFRQKAIAAFADAADGAQTLDRLLNGALDASLRQLGVDIEQLRTGVSAVGSNAIQAFDIVRDELKRTGVEGEEASDTIAAAFNAAFDKVTTSAGLDKLKASLRSAAQEGQISWAEYRAELQRIKEKYAELESAAQASVAGQKRALGDLKQEAQATAKATSATATAASATGGATDTTMESSADTATESGSKRSRSWVSKMAAKLRSQGRDDAAEILSEMIASGDTPTTPKGGGLDAAERWRTAVVNEALARADEVQSQYDQLAEYQRDIAAGDVAAAKELLARRNQFAELEADLVGIVTQAANLVNSSNQSGQTTLSQPGQQVQAPSANEVTVKFDFGDRQIPVRTDSANANALLSELASVARVSR